MAETLEKEFCVIGHPIGHSFSPQIHGLVFRFFSLDLEYSAVDVPPENLENFVLQSRLLKRPGFNVTIPHKQAIIPLLDDMDPLSSRIGAVNTVVLKDKKLVGYNTDVLGFKASLRSSGWNSKGPVTILGAGGAARAVIEALSMLNVAQIMASDIQSEKLSEFQRHFQSLHPEMEIRVSTKDSQEFVDFIGKCSLFVNATPVGMWPEVESVPLDPAILQPGSTVFDLVPKPFHTLLLKKAKYLGMNIIPGIHMLIAQALESDKLFLNRDVPSSLYLSVERELRTFLEVKSVV
jgi:shikimate dehydrogenase